MSAGARARYWLIIAAILLPLLIAGCLPETGPAVTGHETFPDASPVPVRAPSDPVASFQTEAAPSGDVPAVVQPLKVRIENPYTGGTPFKAQLHAHTTESDGRLSPTELAAFYRDAGYQVLAITDHWKFTPPPRVPGILVLVGSEQHPDEGHLVVYGAQTTPDINYIRPAQIRINRMLELGGIAGLAHPNLKTEPWTNEEIAELSGFSLIEVFNGVAGIAEDKWDYVLNLEPRRKVWGTAVDDFHAPEHFGKGWVVIYADELSTGAIMKSLRTGNFYATQGPEIKVQTIGRIIRASTDEPSRFRWTVDGAEHSLQSSRLASEYLVTGREKYVRVTVERDRDGKMAWSQPFFVRAENKPMVETKQAKSRELRPVSRSPEVQHAHQGVAYDGTYWYVIHTTWIKKYDSDWRLVAENNNVNLECGNGHLGDGDVSDGKLYVATDDYVSPIEYGRPHISIWRTSDLSYVTRYDISAMGAESSGCYVDKISGTVYVTSYADPVLGGDADHLHKFSLSDFSYLGKIKFSEPIYRQQGVNRLDNVFWISGGGRLWGVNGSGGVLITTPSLIASSPPRSVLEGITHNGSRLFVLMDEGDASYIYGYEIPIP